MTWIFLILINFVVLLIVLDLAWQKRVFSLHYNSVIEQSLHYFSHFTKELRRQALTSPKSCVPCLQTQTWYFFAQQTLKNFLFKKTKGSHSGILTEPLLSKQAWKSEIGQRSEEWTFRLTPEQIQELTHSAQNLPANLTLQNMNLHHFPLRTLEPHFPAWREELNNGRAFLLVKGVPVSEWTEFQSSAFFWSLGMQLGIAGAQNGNGDLLGHVRNLNKDPLTNRHYLTNRSISYHCDLADIVGLLCLKTPKTGGISRISSSVAIYNEILKTRPDLIPRLYEKWVLDTKGDGGIKWIPVTPVRYSNHRLRTFWHQDYFESGHDYADAPEWDEKERELLKKYGELASSPEFYIEMEFEPGDIQLISNHYVVHSRTAYEDHEKLEDRRHLLRLWLSIEPDEKETAQIVSRQLERFSVIKDLAVRKIVQYFHS